MRIILYTGKGGVGKTSVTAATGLRLAALGHRTLVMSIDPAHSLADAFDMDRTLMDHGGGKPVPIRENLDMQEILIQQEVKRHWASVYDYVTKMLHVSGIDEVVADELAIFPGMEEICSLLYINQYVREETYDVVLVDCAPTGESLRFISIPTTLDWYMSKVFKLERRVMKVARPLLRGVTGVPLPEDEMFVNIETLFNSLRGIDSVLRDAEMTTVRLVTNPEKMVLKETQRAFMYFCLYGLTVDAVIINRILPDDADGEFMEAWRKTQQGYLANIEEFFASVPIWRVPMFRGEVLGTEGLERLGDALYGDEDPSPPNTSEAPMSFTKDGDATLLRMKLPFVRAAEIDLSAFNDELVVQIGNFKRHVSLPRNLVGVKPGKARRDGDVLEIAFPS
ncbi:ArsA family ATPase [Candidatus Poribacteria bacterium]|nr:ArsA family ATPase [Candidatus Poribacteria bacterium]MBT5534444.1 ArsA family ATPase [Candidatus Poribacteria bacterium]MBT5710027.1 ArsA family ATPase [Candidatus Poribacteria bacterium]MBT7100297.1 ArsA family ATPase [Candidatus Poribacteria bacterium]MBT7808790.1 ArsA family ATPase [Candidatus Poribacteria bacterium]